MGEILLFCCTLLLAIVIYLFYNKEKPNITFISAKKTMDSSYKKQLHDKYMRYQDDRPRNYYNNDSPYKPFPNNTNTNNNPPYNYNHKPITNDSIKKDYSFFKDSDIKAKSPIMNNRKSLAFKPGINDSSYNWLLNENNDITQGVKVIKAEDYLNKIPDNTISNNKQNNVLLNTTAIQHMFKNPHQANVNDSPEAKNVIRKLNFNE